MNECWSDELHVKITLLWQLMKDKKVTLGEMRMYLTVYCDLKAPDARTSGTKTLLCVNTTAFKRSVERDVFLFLTFYPWETELQMNPHSQIKRAVPMFQTTVLAALMIIYFFTYCLFCPDRRTEKLIPNHRNITPRSQLKTPNLTALR